MKTALVSVNGSPILTIHERSGDAALSAALAALDPFQPFMCPLCGQRIDDGKPCGCGARK